MPQRDFAGRPCFRKRQNQGSSMKTHAFYIVAILVLTFAGFLVGRQTGQRTELKEIASDPKLAEAAHAVNALHEWGKNIQSNQKEFKERKEAETAAESKRIVDATDGITTTEVRIQLDKLYRGKLLARARFGESEKEPLPFDCLLVRYKLENVSPNTLLDALAYEAADNFGNELESLHEYGYSDACRLLALDPKATNYEKIGPGESKFGFAVFKQPLPNAKWFVVKMSIRKANGDSSQQPLYLKMDNQ